MAAEPFYLKFSGQRFAMHTLPISVLAEFEIFQRLVELQAAMRWKSSNPTKQRLPKGFSKAFELGIADVKEGSAAAELVPLKASGLFTNLDLEEAVKATSEILSTPDASKTQSVADFQFRRIIRKFGASLHEGDVISLSKGTPEAEPIFKFDLAARRRLIRQFSSQKERSISSVGKLVGVHIDEDWSKGRLDVNSGAFGTFAIFIDPDDAKAEYDGTIHSFVKFSVVAEMALNDTIKRIVEVDEVDHIEAGSDDATSQLEKFIGFKDPAVCKEISRETAALCDGFLQAYPDVAARAAIFPGSEGNILLEFELNEWDVTVEISDLGSAEFYGYHLENENEFFETFRDVGPSLYEALVEKEREGW